MEQLLIHSTGLVRRIFEENGQFLVSFPRHASYFTVGTYEMQEELREAERAKRQVSFIFDANMRIRALR